MEPHSHSAYDRLVNHAVDFVLHKLMVKYADNFILPDIVSPFLGGKGNVQLKSGCIKGLTTMKRVGNFLLNVGEDKMDINLKVQFQDIVISYKQYIIKMLGIETSGSFTTNVMKIILRVDLTMKDKSKCLVDVNKVELLELENVTMDFGQCSASRMCWLSKNILRALNENIRSLVEARLNLVLQEILKSDGNQTICKRSLGESLYSDILNFHNLTNKR